MARRRARRFVGVWMAVGLAGVVVGRVTPDTLAVFTDVVPVTGNSFTTADCLRAEVSRVQSGVSTSSANGTTTVGVSTLDPARSFLTFSVSSNSNAPGNSVVRGRIASTTSLEFGRATISSPAPAISIQWHVTEYVCGVAVQRGQTSLSATTVNVAITPVGALNRSFVTFSKTPDGADANWDGNDALVADLTTTSNLRFQADTAGSVNHIIWWQVVEFTNSAFASVQRGSTSLTGTATVGTVTLPTAVDVTKAFVLVSFRTSGSGPDIGARMVRARVIGTTTISVSRSISGSPDDVTEIAWQVVELKDGPQVQAGTSTFAAGVLVATAALTTVDTSRTIAITSTQGGAGQSMGRSPYAGDDIPGVSHARLTLAPTQLTLTRGSSVDAADTAWFVIQF